MKANKITACEVGSCLVRSQCLKSDGVEVNELNVFGRILLNGKDINNEEESVQLSNFIGQIEVIPEIPQSALDLPPLSPVPQGVFVTMAGVPLPNYVALYQVPDRAGIRHLDELKELYSKIVLTNVGDIVRNVAFALFIYSANSYPLDPRFPERTFNTQVLDLDVKTMIPGSINTFSVNWNSWRSSLNVIRDSSEVVVFTAVMLVGQRSDLAFLRTFFFSSESLSHHIYAIYSNYCVKGECPSPRSRLCGNGRCASSSSDELS